jgi:hypothetical protein
LPGEHHHGAFEAVAAQDLAGLAAVEIGKADIEKDEIDVIVARKLEAVRRIGGEHRLELFMQRELLAQ